MSNFDKQAELDGEGVHAVQGAVQGGDRPQREDDGGDGGQDKRGESCAIAIDGRPLPPM